MVSSKKSSSKAVGAHIALLRGINVGGKNMLPMKDLAEMFVAAGCSDVCTYIQSGNVAFTADAELARRIPESITEAIARRFHLSVPVVTRSAKELRRISEQNPYWSAGVDMAILHVVFLADRPSASKVAALDPKRSPPDEFSVHGRELYLRCPNGVAHTKLTNAYFDSTLATVSTVRNWNTVTKLLDLCGDA